MTSVKVFSEDRPLKAVLTQLGVPSSQYRIIPSLMRSSAVRIAIVFVLYAAFVIGCGPRVRSDTVTVFGTAVGKVRDQVKVAIGDANVLARDQAKAAVLADPDPEKGLTEERFVLAVNRADAVQWDNAFAGMQAYAAALQSLLTTEMSDNFGDTTLKLGEELSQGYAKMPLPPGVGTAFTEIGKVLIEAHQQRDALAAMRKADPGIRAAMISMAKAIGNDPRGRSAADTTRLGGGLMGTVYSTWDVAMGRVAAQFVKSREGHDIEGKRTAINDYLALIDRRDAELDSLASLRQSLLSLADIHTVASQGSSAGITGNMAVISQKLDNIQTTYRKFSDLTKENK